MTRFYSHIAAPGTAAIYFIMQVVYAKYKKKIQQLYKNKHTK